MQKNFFILLLIATLTLSGCAYHAEIVRLPDTPLYNRITLFNNIQYIPLIRFCDYYNLAWDWDLVLQKIVVKKNATTVVLRPESYFALVNNKSMELDYTLEYKDGAVYIPAEFASFLSKDIFKLEERITPVVARHSIRTVVIDPGHGGKDPGAVNKKYGIKEKNVVLDISKQLKRYLENNGLTVVLSREKDVFIPLHKRAELANRKGADLFISVHANASRYSRAKGFEVYHLSEATDDSARALAIAENASLQFEDITVGRSKDALSATVWDMVLTENRRESKELAYYICNITSDILGVKNRGVKGARFVVLKGARMPAVLVEVGFLSNPREGYSLNKSSYKEKIARAIARSIVSYKREYERTNGFTR